MNWNTNLSDTARTAAKRIMALQIVQQKTGFKTIEEQNRTLLALNDDDMLAVADVIAEAIRRGRENRENRDNGGVR